MNFTRKIDGPVRVVQVANVPGQYLAVDRLGRFLAQGFREPLEEMAEAFNSKYSTKGDTCPVCLDNPGPPCGRCGAGKAEAVKVTACPECGYPKESEEQAKCLTCLNPPLPTVEEEVKQKEVEQSEWF